MTKLKELMGKKEVQLAEEGVTGHMVGIKRLSSAAYMVECKAMDIKNIANKVKSVPQEWINDRGNDVTTDFIKYARPLIQGETKITYNNGIPSYMDISHLDSH